MDVFVFLLGLVGFTGLVLLSWGIVVLGAALARWLGRNTDRY